jgi:hypothetical protein
MTRLALLHQVILAVEKIHAGIATGVREGQEAAAIEARERPRESRVGRGVGEFGRPAAENAHVMRLRPGEEGRDLPAAMAGGDGVRRRVGAVQAGEEGAIAEGCPEGTADAVPGGVDLRGRCGESRMQQERRVLDPAQHRVAEKAAASQRAGERAASVTRSWRSMMAASGPSRACAGVTVYCCNSSGI